MTEEGEEDTSNRDSADPGNVHISTRSQRKVIKVQKMLKLRRTATTKKIPDEDE